MLLPDLIRTIESHADEITTELMTELRTNPRTTYLHRVSEGEVRTRANDLFSHLSRWIEEDGEDEISQTYRELGGRRCREGVPPSELLYALVLAKAHLISFIRRNDTIESSLELQQECELLEKIHHFFDRASYYATRAYELEPARGAGMRR
ncbi:hypothetical protein PHYC_01624 [Phycisphaerales bacterium]|nr:hypothetical protein PHYC_01624 [Phycisphaerales bacterium]